MRVDSNSHRVVVACYYNHMLAQHGTIGALIIAVLLSAFIFGVLYTF